MLGAFKLNVNQKNEESLEMAECRNEKNPGRSMPDTYHTAQWQAPGPGSLNLGSGCFMHPPGARNQEILGPLPSLGKWVWARPRNLQCMRQCLGGSDVQSPCSGDGCTSPTLMGRGCLPRRKHATSWPWRLWGRSSC